MFSITLQNILFCVLQKKLRYTGLEQHEGEQIMTEFLFFEWTLKKITIIFIKV